MKFNFLHKVCTLFVMSSVLVSSVAFNVSAEVGANSEVSGTWDIPTDTSIVTGNGNVFADTAATDNERHTFTYTFTGSSQKQYILDMSFTLDGHVMGRNCDILYINDANNNLLGTLYCTWTGDFYFTHMPNDTAQTGACAAENCGVLASVNGKTHPIKTMKLELSSPAVNAYNAVAANKYAVRLYVDNENDYFTIAAKNVTRGDADYTYAEHKTNESDKMSHPLRFPLSAEAVFGGISMTTPNMQANSKFTVHDFKIRQCYNPEITGASITNGAASVTTASAVVFNADNPITGGLNQIKISANDTALSFDTAPFTLSADKKTLTYTGSLESDGMVFSPYTLTFTTEAAPENFFDGFDSGKLSGGWNADADENGVSAALSGGILSVAPAARSVEKITFKPGGNSGEYWVDASISMKGMLQFHAHPIIKVLGNSGSIGEVYLTWTASPYARIGESVRIICRECDHDFAGETAISLPVSCRADANGGAEGNDVKVREDELDLRFYVNTEDNYFTCGMKSAGDASYSYAQHTDSSGNTHPVKFGISSGELLCGIEFNSPDYSVLADNREFNIHAASIRKYIHSEIVSSTVVRDAVDVPVSSNVEFTFSKPITAGIENIKVYENGVELPSSSLVQEDSTLKLAAPLKYSSKYEIKIPGSGVEWNGMMFKEEHFVFSTEHQELGVTYDSPKAVDADGNPIADINALTPGTVDEVKTALNINSDEAKTVTVIGVLYKTSGGKRVAYDIIAEKAELKAGANSFVSKGALQLPEAVADRNGLELKIYVWDTVKSMRSADTYAPSGKMGR